MPGLEFTVASVVAHAAEAPLGTRSTFGAAWENVAFSVKVLTDVANETLLASLMAAARALAAGVDTAPPDTWGSDPFGRRIPPGSPPWRATSSLSMALMRRAGRGSFCVGRVARRSGPGPPVSLHAVSPGDDPWELLLWANGRVELPGLIRQDVWRWQRAPLSEWDGAGT